MAQRRHRRRPSRPCRPAGASCAAADTHPRRSSARPSTRRRRSSRSRPPASCRVTEVDVADAARDDHRAPPAAARSRSSRCCAPGWRWSRASCASLPDARVGHLGMQRDEEELTPRDYYERLPSQLADAYVYLLDPMLATGGSAVHALDRLRQAGARRLALICLVAAPEGLAAVEAAPPRRRRLDRGGRPPARRARLHPPGPGRRGRPRVRHAIARSRAAGPRGAGRLGPERRNYYDVGGPTLGAGGSPPGRRR